jgi:type VI secretion system VasD/TssJ family lipoprotein
MQKTSEYKSYFLQALIVTVCTLLSMCTTPPQSDPYIYRANGLQFDIRADQMLNSYDGEAHALKLAVYQLSDNAAFIELQKNAEGAKKLLKISKFDPTVIGYEQIIVRPNESRIVTLDRINQAKWIGVVAGYYNADNGKYPSALIKIGSVSKKKSFIRRAGEFLKLLAPSDIQYVPQIAFQLMLTPITMYETSVFR